MQMKEVMAFIRPTMVNATKKALEDSGFPAFSCRPCLGRGKKKIDPALIEYVTNNGELPEEAGSDLIGMVRLLPKRAFTVIVNDDQVKSVVDVLIKTNQTGKAGDGKIFVLPIMEAYRVRDDAQTENAY